MPRELTRRSAPFQVLQGDLDFEIRDQGRTVRVALFGNLDRRGLAQVIRRAAPHLSRRGRRVELDGSRLKHLDFRAVPLLTAWNHQLREFGHELLLDRWSAYLKSILLVGALPLAGGLRRRGARRI